MMLFRLLNVVNVTCCLLLCVVVGCDTGPKEKAKAKVAGTVNLDGKPLADGEIAFVKAAEGVNEILPVKDGKFSGQASSGDRKVEIRAFREAKLEGAGGYTPPGGGSGKENYLPAQFNTSSTLTTKVEEGKSEALNFDVTSK